MYTVISVLILVISFYVFIQAIAELQSLLSNIHFSDLFKKHNDEVGVEIPEVESPQPKYDVVAFKKRIEMMKDEDGLYEISPPPKSPSDFTGAEVITESYEKEIDEFLRSR